MFNTSPHSPALARRIAPLLLDRLCDLAAPVVFFPVRHHSPACARLARGLIERLQPAGVLIEGPADFNPYLDELALPHQLPIAIYSYVRLADGQRRGAFYPFCDYSPEWQAMAAARACGAAIRLIDLPWAEMATAETVSHRYADAELRRSRYVAALCRQLGVEDFNALWDTLCEIDGSLSLDEYLRRAHNFCAHIRLAEDHVAEEDRRREAYMAEQIRAAQAELGGPLVIVTGGYHSYALFARLHQIEFVGTIDPPAPAPAAAKGPGGTAVDSSAEPASDQRGIALTPYSYERLDSLRGYEAGMPNPGFYHQVWLDRQEARGSHQADDGARGTTYRAVLARVTQRLRERGQVVSTADLIAVETTAQGLAAMRGHAEVWRWDLVDAVTSALVKEELAVVGSHPFLEAVHDALRGEQCGQVAAGARMPPLVTEVKAALAQLELTPVIKPTEVELDLHSPGDRRRSRLLHQLRLLSIVGFERIDGVDFGQRGELARLWERWRLRWSPDLESSLIEASRFGPRAAEAAQARLQELAVHTERDAERAALLLLDAALAGLDQLQQDFQQRLLLIVRQDANFFSNAAALNHLLYLFRYDEVLGTVGRDDVGSLLRETFTRSMWLLESLGQVSGKNAELVDGVSTLLHTFQAGGDFLEDLRQEYLEVARRVQQDESQLPLARGACWGTLWSLGVAGVEQTAAAIEHFADPQRLGDFLAGLFALAREAVQRHPDLVRGIDRMLVGYSEQEFMAALPALRLAFTYFTPREKHYLATTLLQAVGAQVDGSPAMAALEVTPVAAAEALAWEGELFSALARYGLRGADELDSRAGEEP